MTDSVSHRLKALQDEWRKAAEAHDSMADVGIGGQHIEQLAYAAICRKHADALTPLIASEEGRAQAQPPHETGKESR